MLGDRSDDADARMQSWTGYASRSQSKIDKGIS
jgi:hypothetical protein